MSAANDVPVTPPITHHDLAQLRSRREPFSAPGWAFELKLDGFRALAVTDDDDVHLFSRKGNPLLPCFPEIREQLLQLPPLVLDGELVVLDKEGRPQFDRLARRFRMKRALHIEHAAKTEPAAIFAFDLLEYQGSDLRKQTLEKRKAILKRVLKDSTRIRYVEHIGEEGERLFAMAAQIGLEGVVAKPLASTYQRGYGSGWLKTKTPAGIAIEAERRKWNE